ncbi:MAG: hypothetical protein JW938_04565 [Candidatus Omnitrophica bacterium]|nr:hypothetical protein [Candidatus Omnitrophota bacterium]
MPHYWFKPKQYGYGLQPITWQGWVATLIFALVIVACGFLTGALLPHATVMQWALFVANVVILIMIFMMLFKDRTDGEVRWRWGRDEE